MATKRVGTFTAGISLIAVGVGFGLYTIWPLEPLLKILVSLWPLVLICLGVELLVKSKQEACRVDFGSVIVMLLCVGFAVCASAVQFCLAH